MKKRKFKLVNKKPLAILAGLLALVILAVAAYSHIGKKEQEPFYVLLLGIDARGEETMTRADTIILAAVDQQKNKVAFLSIPRDTRIAIPGFGVEKINNATVHGGPELAESTVSRLLGVTVENYVQVDFLGFKNVVDALGGVTIDVEEKMYHVDPEDDFAYHIDLDPGEQRRLDGAKALQFVRYRDYPLGDITRLDNQHKMLVALGRELMQPSTIIKLPALIPEIHRYVKTNLNPTDVLALSTILDTLNSGDIVTCTLPGSLMDVSGVSYWEPTPPEEANLLLKSFFQDQNDNE